MARQGRRQQRRNYAQVSSAEETANGPADEALVDETEGSTSRNSRRSSHRRRQQQQYNRVAASEDNNDVEQGAAVNRDDVASATGTVVSEASSLLDEEEDSFVNSSGGVEQGEAGDDDGRRLTVVILDVAQKKFHVTVHPTATVATLKQAGYKIHKVSPDRQRLIFRGKMLQDEEETMEQLGITEEKTIVHLFPKPRVVIKDNNNSEGGTESSAEGNSDNDGDTNNGENDGDEEEGARVPTIVLDAEEAERRSQILVLGSTDYLEAQNNVKLFSFMLLIISSIELMNLLAVALGVPQDDSGGDSETPVTIDDDIFPHNHDEGGGSDGMFQNNTSGYDSTPLEAEPWTFASWVDLIISIMGVYVGILGLQATTHNTLRLAKHYLYGTVLTGVGWMLFNFVMTYAIDEEAEEEREENPNINDDYVLPDNSDLRWQAISVMVLPGMVWVLCCLRAWQFQHLLLEAEQEAEERIRSEFATVVRAAGDGNEEADGDDNQADEEADEPPSPRQEPPNHDEELALQNQSARIS